MLPGIQQHSHQLGNYPSGCALGCGEGDEEWKGVRAEISGAKKGAEKYGNEAARRGCLLFSHCEGSSCCRSGRLDTPGKTTIAEMGRADGGDSLVMVSQR